MSFTKPHQVKTSAESCLGFIQEAGEASVGYRMRKWHSNPPEEEALIGIFC